MLYFTILIKEVGNKKVNYKLIVIVIIGLFLLQTSEMFQIVIPVVIVGYIVYANRKVWKQLSVWQLLGMILFFGALITVVAGLLYYVASPLVNLITINWISYIAKIILVIVVLIPTSIIFHKGMLKISGGKFPDLNIEEVDDLELKQIITELDQSKNPINSRLRQLVKNGEEVKAVKEAREYFSYSLLKAKKYVDRL